MVFLSIGNKNYKSLLNQIEHYDNIEIRLDLCDLNNAQIAELFSLEKRFIATFRGELSNKIFGCLKLAIESGASFCDIDIREDETYRQNLKEICELNNCRLIYSYHNYLETPSSEFMRSIIQLMSDQGAEISKIVCTAYTIDDTLKIMSLYKDKEHKIIAFSLGDFGKFTRVCAVPMGAAFTYASLDDENKTAPGQINYEKLSTIMANLID